MRGLIVLSVLLLALNCQAEDIKLTSDFTVHKPNIHKDKFKLTEDEQKQVEKALKHEGRRLIHTELKPVKNDYQNDFDRGTVDYTPRCRNYSFHKVVIPDGTIVRESNFFQKEPHSNAITGKNLTFIGCNLINVEKDATWIIQDSNTCQIKRVKKSEEVLENGQKKVIISHQVERGGIFIEEQTDEETVSVGDDYDLLMLRLNK